MSNIHVEDEIVMRHVSTIKPYIRNPRKNNKTVDLLTKLIPKVGFNVPIVIDEKGVIVKGHARFTAALRLGMDEVPCIISHADPELIKADRIADNKISEFSEWVTDDLMAEINEIEFDLSDLGLPKVNLDEVPSAEDVEKNVMSNMYQDVSTDTHNISDVQIQNLYKEFESGYVPESIQMTENNTENEPVSEDEFNDMIYYKCVCEKCGHTMFIKGE